MPDRWELKSRTYDNCNCAMNCGCQFNLPSTHGYCQTVYVGTVVEGNFNETPLAGLKWAALYKWPGEVAAGNGARLIVIDERADEAQRAALETIVSGEACVPLSNVFSVYGSMCEEFLHTLFRVRSPSVVRVLQDLDPASALLGYDRSSALVQRACAAALSA